MSTILRTILVGTCDPRSPLRHLRTQPIILRWVWKLLQDLWQSHIYKQDAWGYPPFWVLESPAVFPRPRDLYANMMPFVLGDKQSLPKKFRGYWKLIKYCADVAETKSTAVCYLTVHESRVDNHEPQRRGGLHTESPGVLGPGTIVSWGGLLTTGGIFIASSVANSTQVWPVAIRDLPGVVGDHGDLEHIRPVLGPGQRLDANKLVWMSDTTPHESLPLPPGTYRQFFRLVMDDVSVWYQDHSTPNPLGTVPGPQTIIMVGDKFKGTAVPK